MAPPVFPRAYRGRFAPSPTGPLHFGSLVAALGSCLEARARGGEWLLRIEDVDEPRCSAAIADGMLRDLARLGFEWDGAAIWQSRRKPRYRELLEALKAAGRAYPCACTRRELADSALARDGAAIYPGTCRHGVPPGKAARAWRLRVDDVECGFSDDIQGVLSRQLARDAGDFVLLRADGYFAYQLAVVADDADQGITHVVRGADLIESTPRQIHLQSCLGFSTPAYAHLPVVVNAAGEKLSKQTQATAVTASAPAHALTRALGFLGQAPPDELAGAGVADVWCWARANWRLENVPRARARPVSD